MIGEYIEYDSLIQNSISLNDQYFRLNSLTSKENIIQKDTCTPVFIPALFTTARTWKHPKCPSTEMDKEGMVHIYNGILLRHKKE